MVCAVCDCVTCYVMQGSISLLARRPLERTLRWSSFIKAFNAVRVHDSRKFLPDKHLFTSFKFRASTINVVFFTLTKFVLTVIILFGGGVMPLIDACSHKRVLIMIVRYKSFEIGLLLQGCIVPPVKSIVGKILTTDEKPTWNKCFVAIWWN